MSTFLDLQLGLVNILLLNFLARILTNKILNNIGNKIVNVCSILTSFVLPILTANCFVMAESSIIPFFLSTLVVIHSKLNMVSYNHKLLMGKCILHLNSIRKLLAFWWTHKWCINFILENSEIV